MLYLKNTTTLKYTESKCTGCGMCMTVCPHLVFDLKGDNSKKVYVKNKNACMECGACAKNCPSSALEVRAGVGCAYAIMYSKLRGKKELTCDCNCD